MTTPPPSRDRLNVREVPLRGVAERLSDRLGSLGGLNFSSKKAIDGLGGEAGGLSQKHAVPASQRHIGGDALDVPACFRLLESCHGGKTTATLATVSRHILKRADISFHGGSTLAGTVAKSPTPKSPKFGAWLLLRRGKRSLEQIARQVRPLLPGMKVDQSLIFKIEAGRVPSWPILSALAVVYEVPLAEMSQRLADAITFDGREAIERATAHDRADPAHSEVPKKIMSPRPPSVTSSVPDADVLDQQSSIAGGAQHGNSAAFGSGGTTDRLSESQSARDAEMRRITELDQLVSLIARLDTSAESVRFVADALRAHVGPAATRTSQPARPGHGAGIRPAKTRRTPKR